MKLNPYLMFNGNCAEAFKFYEESLGGKILGTMTYGESPASEHMPAELNSLIIHTRMQIGDILLMAGDAPPHLYSKPTGIYVSLSVDTPEEAERIYAALSEGGSISMPMEETFFAHRFSMFVDRFGTPWMVNCEKPFP